MCYFICSFSWINLWVHVKKLLFELACICTSRCGKTQYVCVRLKSRTILTPNFTRDFKEKHVHNWRQLVCYVKLTLSNISNDNIWFRHLNSWLCIIYLNIHQDNMSNTIWSDNRDLRNHIKTKRHFRSTQTVSRMLLWVSKIVLKCCKRMTLNQNDLNVVYSVNINSVMFYCFVCLLLYVL